MDELELDSREGRDAARDLLLQWIWTLYHAHQPGGDHLARSTLETLRRMVDEVPAQNADAIGR